MSRDVTGFGVARTALGAMLVAAAVGSTPVTAAVIAVTSTEDAVLADGNCTLREAVRSANEDVAYDACTAGSGDDVVSLGAGTYMLTIVGANEDAAASGDLDVTANLAIAGAGATLTTIDGNGAVTHDRVLELIGSITVAISGVTVTGGTMVQEGGGVRVNGATLVVSNSAIISNTANSGGGIGDVGTVTLVDSTLSDNTALNGGGIACGDVSILRSTVSGNHADAGGGLRIFGAGTIDQSTISGNTAMVAAGVLSNGTLVMTNSTLSGNRSDQVGGGLVHNNATGTATLVNVTVTGNVADDDANGTGDGGGIVNEGGDLRVKGTIVAGNLDRGGEAPDCVGLLDSQGYNLVQSTAGCTLSGDTATNLLAVDPLLGPLQSNGGPTFTHALLVGSPAFDAIPLATCTDAVGGALGGDQRNVGRPQAAACDMGAFEADGLPTTTTTTSTTSTSSSTPTTTSTITSTTSTTTSTSTSSSTSSSSSSSTVAPITTSTTMLPPECTAGVPSACDDDDSCTADSCVAGRCRHDPATGTESARCVCGRLPLAACGAETLPTAASRQLTKACERLDRAGSSTSAARTKHLVRRAIASEKQAGRIVRRLGARGRVSQACAGALGVFLDDALARAKSVLKGS
ncbi:MAG TPA: right-handed parallel beta-helix repeat-containing protein [Candidatus Eisenbacteria bacterium]|nr:right-handed parallel beta-helix repeat-containing protein [Candidatus Eisenbacteria bacterium]